MNNQVNVDDQNTQQIGKNSINPPVQIPKKAIMNYWMVSTVILFLVLIGSSFYTLRLMNKITGDNPNIEQTSTPTPTNNTTTITESTPTISSGSIYSNQKYYFSISAPDGFEIAESPFQFTSILNVMATNQIPIGQNSWEVYAKDNEIKIDLSVMKKDPKNDTWGWGSFNGSNDIYQKLASLAPEQNFEMRSNLFYSTGIKNVNGIIFQMFRTGPNIGYPSEYIDSVGAVAIVSDTTFYFSAQKGTNRTTEETKQALDKMLLTFKVLESN